MPNRTRSITVKLMDALKVPGDLYAYLLSEYMPSQSFVTFYHSRGGPDGGMPSSKIKWEDMSSAHRVDMMTAFIKLMKFDVVDSPLRLREEQLKDNLMAVRAVARGASAAQQGRGLDRLSGAIAQATKVAHRYFANYKLVRGRCQVAVQHAYIHDMIAVFWNVRAATKDVFGKARIEDAPLFAKLSGDETTRQALDSFVKQYNKFYALLCKIRADRSVHEDLDTMSLDCAVMFIWYDRNMFVFTEPVVLYWQRFPCEPVHLPALPSRMSQQNIDRLHAELRNMRLNETSKAQTKKKNRGKQRAPPAAKPRVKNTASERHNVEEQMVDEQVAEAIEYADVTEATWIKKSSRQVSTSRDALLRRIQKVYNLAVLKTHLNEGYRQTLIRPSGKVMMMLPKVDATLAPHASVSFQNLERGLFHVTLGNRRAQHWYFDKLGDLYAADIYEPSTGSMRWAKHQELKNMSIPESVAELKKKVLLYLRRHQRPIPNR